MRPDLPALLDSIRQMQAAGAHAEVVDTLAPLPEATEEPP